MADGIDEFRIRASLDAAQVHSEAQAVVGDMGAMKGATLEAGEAAESAADQQEKLIKQLQEQRTALFNVAINAHRLTEGFKDLQLGGRYAGQGLLDIEEGLQRILPLEAQVPLAIGTMLGSFLLLATSHKDGGRHAAEHANAEKQAAVDIKNAWDQWLDAYGKQLDDIAKKQKTLIDQDAQLITDAQSMAKMAADQDKLDKGKSLEALRAQYLGAQATATPEQREELKQRYEAAKKDIEDGTELNTAALNAAEKLTELELQTKKLNDLKKQNSEDTVAAAEAWNRAQAAKGRLDPYGISLDKDGNLTRVDPDSGERIDPIAQLDSKIESGEKYLNALPLLPTGEGPSDLDAAMAQQKETLRQLRIQREQMVEDRRALAEGDVSEKKYKPILEDHAKQIADLETKLGQLQTEFSQAKQAASQAATNWVQDQKQAQIDAKRREQETLRKAQENEDNAAVSNAQTDLDNATTNEARDKARKALAAAKQQADQHAASFEQGAPIALPAPAPPPVNPYAESVAQSQNQIKEWRAEADRNPDSRFDLDTMIAGEQKKLDTALAAKAKWDAANANNTPATAPTAQAVLQQSIADKWSAAEGKAGAGADAQNRKDDLDAQKKAQSAAERTSKLTEKAVDQALRQTEMTTNHVARQEALNARLEAKLKQHDQALKKLQSAVHSNSRTSSGG